MLFSNLMRLFIAIVFPDDVVDRLSRLRDAIHDEAESGTFVSRENLHLTLEFLGECRSRECRLAKEAMEAVHASPFSIVLDRTGFFQRPDGDIWWVGAGKSRELQDLHAALSSALSERGFMTERKKFRPHVTLGRRVVTRFCAGSIEAIRVSVASMTLMLSERGDKGMIYTPLHETRFF